MILEGTEEVIDTHPVCEEKTSEFHNANRTEAHIQRH